MKKFMTVAVCSVFALGVASAPASAGWKEDCAAKIKALEANLEGASGSANGKDQIADKLAKAKQGLAKGKKNKCFKMADKAADQLQRMGN